MPEEVSQQKKRKALEKQRTEEAANFLIRSSRNGIFYQNGVVAYLIPVQNKLGYKMSPLRVN